MPEMPLKPPDLDAEPADSVYCFFTQERPCSAECMAYKTFPEENNKLEPFQRHCVLLQGIERGARSLNIIAGLVNAYVGKRKVAEADAQREKAFETAPTSPAGQKK